jgi:hypothetical protein
VRLLTDPSGNHLPLSTLAHYRKFVHIPEPGTDACAAHGRHGTFVVTDALLDRFGMGSLRDWLALLSGAGLLAEGYSVVEGESAEHASVSQDSVCARLQQFTGPLS